MNRTDVYKDIESKFGIVPTFFKTLPDDSLQMEWELMNRVHLEPGAVPNKYRELIGLGIAATSRCRYCTYFHTQIAKLFGAEIEETVHYASRAQAGAPTSTACRPTTTSSSARSARSSSTSGRR